MRWYAADKTQAAASEAPPTVVRRAYCGLITAAEAMFFRAFAPLQTRNFNCNGPPLLGLATGASPRDLFDLATRPIFIDADSPGQRSQREPASADDSTDGNCNSLRRARDLAYRQRDDRRCRVETCRHDESSLDSGM